MKQKYAREGDLDRLDRRSDDSGAGGEGRESSQEVFDDIESSANRKVLAMQQLNSISSPHTKGGAVSRKKTELEESTYADSGGRVSTPVDQQPVMVSVPAHVHT